MYLLPTDEDIARLYCFIDPETRFLFAASVQQNFDGSFYCKVDEATVRYYKNLNK